MEKNKDIWHRIKEDGPINSLDGFEYWIQRNKFVGKYSWAVPTPDAILRIKDFVAGDTLLEIGCGSGLWAHLLSEDGVSVIATDSGSETFTEKYHDIDYIDADSAVAKYSSCNALLTCWSRVYIPENFKGKKYIYIGEKPGGCTNGYPSEDSNWKLIEKVEIPQWRGINDSVYLFSR